MRDDDAVSVEVQGEDSTWVAPSYGGDSDTSDALLFGSVAGSSSCGASGSVMSMPGEHGTMSTSSSGAKGLSVQGEGVGVEPMPTEGVSVEPSTKGVKLKRESDDVKSSLDRSPSSCSSTGNST